MSQKNFYVASQEGIWIKTPRNEKPETLLDTPAFSIDPIPCAHFPVSPLPRTLV